MKKIVLPVKIGAAPLRRILAPNDPLILTLELRLLPTRSPGRPEVLPVTDIVTALGRGPRTYTQLRDAFPHVGPSTLKRRLAAAVESGVVDHVDRLYIAK